ncbi:MAG TPA: hypothetical protein VN953_10715 [Gemmatimonadales bacterium]|nr:hypothetical protein [Gemmatimonadales bacterium]
MVVASARLRAATLACLAFVLTACSDTSGPGASIDVIVSLVSMDGPTLSVGPDSAPRIACNVDVRATATGSGRATWGDATLRLFAGKDRSTPIDTFVVPAATVQSAWGKPDIGPGESEESGAQFAAEIPFGGEIRYRYSPSGSGTKTAVFRFDCGPAPTVTSFPPVITALSVEPPTGPVQPGDILKLDYRATSRVGLWETTIALSGPCTARWILPEGLQQSVTRVVSVAIPFACRLGVPLRLSATAVDAAAQAVSGSVEPGIALVDVTPPSVELLLFPPPAGSATNLFAGEYFVGDSLNFMFIASDNVALRTLVWEVTPAGFRDSLLVSGRSAVPRPTIPIQPSWIGPIQLRAYARDSVGLVSDTFVSPLDSLRVYPTLTRPTTAAAVEGEITELAIDQRRGVIYLAQGYQRRLAVLSTASMTVSATLALPAASADLDLTASGDSLVVALPSLRALGVIDLRQSPLAVALLPLTVLDTTIDQWPSSVRVAANGKALVLLEGSSPSAFTLIEVDLGTQVQRLRTDAGDGGNVGVAALERSFDHSTVVLRGNPTLFQRYDATSDAFGPRHSVASIGTMSVDGTGQHVVLGVDVYDATLGFLRRTHSPFIGWVPTAVSADGQYLYQGVAPYGIVRSRVSDGVMIDRSLGPVFTGGLVRMSPDGPTLVIVDSNCCGTSHIAVMDLR